MIKTTTQNDNVDIFLLPEHWYYMDAHSKDFLKNIQEKRGEYYQFCQSMSEKYNIRLISGAIWENEPEYKRPVINTYYFDSNGKEQFCQKKVPLYIWKINVWSGSELIIYRTSIRCPIFGVICFGIAFYEMPRLAVNGGWIPFIFGIN